MFPPPRRRLLSQPRTRVELHAHLDGCVRPETAWELLKAKGLPLPGDGTFRALQDALFVRHPIDLAHFLAPFGIYTPAIVGDLKAMERVAFEFCEDKARDGVLYVEARYTPHCWLPEDRWKLDELSKVVEAVQRGFDRAERDLGIKVRSILAVLNGMGIANDIVELCKRFQGKGVVGIDMAAPSKMASKHYEEVPLTEAEMDAFSEAEAAGVHRTVHAGESGGANMVQRAVERYGAERIGHGYRVVEDDEIYDDCRRRRIHFECCPWSSLLTGAVHAGVATHPIAQFAEDNANFSISTDDTTITGLQLQDDYDLASSWGLTEAHFIRANLNAARSCFLPDSEKKALMADIVKNMCIPKEVVAVFK